MAAKKSFKGANPAMQFINAAIEEAPPATAAAAPVAPAPQAVPIAQAAPPLPLPSARPVGQGGAASDSPATESREFVERKTKRLNLLLQPSILDGLSKVAHMKQTSVNDLINTILKEYNDGNRALIEKYQRIFMGEE